MVRWRKEVIRIGIVISIDISAVQVQQQRTTTTTKNLASYVQSIDLRRTNPTCQTIVIVIAILSSKNAFVPATPRHHQTKSLTA